LLGTCSIATPSARLAKAAATRRKIKILCALCCLCALCGEIGLKPQAVRLAPFLQPSVFSLQPAFFTMKSMKKKSVKICEICGKNNLRQSA